MTTYIATTTSEAKALITAANGGDTVLLAAGTYDGLKLSGLTKSSTVTIMSQDAAAPAVLTNFSADRINGFNFSDLEFNTTSDGSMMITNSRNLVFDDLDVHGSLNGTSSDDFRGMLVRNSANVVVSNSHFHELTDALNHLDSDGITFTGNTFDLIRDDGIAGGGTSNIVVSNNYFTNFDHDGEVHPDAIQFWTTNTDAAASNITVSGNVFDRGTGSAVQGIWIKDDVGNRAYKNVSVTDNVIVGAAYNGIVVRGAVSATVRGNTVIGAEDQQSWIGLTNVTFARVDDNIATSYNYVNSNALTHGNVLATSLALAPDGSYLSALMTDPVLGPQLRDMDGRAQRDIFSNISLLGFIDGPSRYGTTYDFPIVNVQGTSGDDRLTVSTAGSYHLYGYDGNDALIGNRNKNASVFEGGAGNDSYTIYQAIDTIIENPGEGNDTIYTMVSYTMPENVEALRAGLGGLTLTGNGADNTLSCAVSGDVLYGMGGNDTLQGSDGDDQLFGGADADRVFGGSGNDYVSGGTGDDQLYGGSGRDALLGGSGDDYLEGGSGIDTLTGGDGADSFAYRSSSFSSGVSANKDIITDFSAREGDRIVLSQVDGDTSTARLDDFTFIGSQGYHGVAGELRYAADGDGITVYGDTDGDKSSDFAIHLVGLTTISSSAFLF